MRLVDAHTHVSSEQSGDAVALAESGLWQLVAATKPEECQAVAQLARQSDRIVPTYGLHPWYAGDHRLDAMDPWLTEAPIIGEIGLDTVWAPSPLSSQIPAFLHQLRLARQLQKTVLLHTKGAETEILNWLWQITPPVIIIHWYSGPSELLADYIELGCYFTLGPDIHTNPAVQAVCKQVPLERLLTETDGTGAVTWATGKPCSLQDVPRVLDSTLAKAAELKQLTPARMRVIVYENSLLVLKHGSSVREAQD